MKLLLPPPRPNGSPDPPTQEPAASPGTNTRVWLVRHAEVAPEYHGVAYGAADVPLSERGREQSQAVARSFEGERVAPFPGPDVGRHRQQPGQLGFQRLDLLSPEAEVGEGVVVDGGSAGQRAGPGGVADDGVHDCTSANFAGTTDVLTEEAACLSGAGAGCTFVPSALRVVEAFTGSEFLEATCSGECRDLNRG